MPNASEFHQTYQQHAPYVFRVIQRLGASDAALEDLVHDVFVAAWRAWPKLDLSRPIKPWLFGISYRVLLDYHRRRSTWSEAPTAELPDGVDQSAGPAEVLARRQGLTLAAKLIAALDIERRAVFVMHELEELPMPQIAEALEVPLNTAYSRLRLARRDFAQAAASLEPSNGA